MIVAILIALLVSILVYVLTDLAVRKLPIPAELVWLCWLVCIIILILVWWRLVIGPLVGPLP